MYMISYKEIKTHDTSHHIIFSGQPRVGKLEKVRYFLVCANLLTKREVWMAG